MRVKCKLIVHELIVNGGFFIVEVQMLVIEPVPNLEPFCALPH